MGDSKVTDAATQSASMTELATNIANNKWAIGYAGFGAYNKAFAPNRTGYDWLSVSEENVDAYIADPLCGGMASTGLFLELLDGMAFIKKPANLRHMNMATPVLFISGDRDPVGGMGKGVRAAYDSFRRAGVRDAELKLYPGLRHEILNEDCRAQVYDDLWEWIERHNG